ncbi:2Fe-2S iron-sulfur cluster-binding protein [Nocardia jinanensis]|uniref:2Fe-2S iron-sulfur cluster-binding protein n=1 Tax=Nocardia jinanensis TaxID=382504 RepID=UPI001E4F472D|nr:2Fe-2S iron-sulfur cluster-binding protein [Nocardia jinanensis]
MEPAGIDLDVAPGQTIFETALAAGVTWPTVCFGQARCTACALKILDGHQNAGPVEPEERDLLQQMASRRRRSAIRDTRIACRMTVLGPVTVDKRGAKRQTDPEANGDRNE